MKVSSNWSSMRRTSPGTIGLVISILVAWVGHWATQGKFLMSFAFAGFDKPWTVFTFPWAYATSGANFLFMLLGLLWLFFIGSALEREVGTKWLLGLFAIISVVAALFQGIGAMALNTVPFDASPFVPVAILTVMWGARNPKSLIMLYGVIPLSGTLMAVLSGLSIFFTKGDQTLLYGLFAALPALLAWFYAQGKLGLPYPSGARVAGTSSAKDKKREQAEFNKYIDNVRERESERAEREKLRELFERSLIQDPDDNTKNG